MRNCIGNLLLDIHEGYHAVEFLGDLGCHVYLINVMGYWLFVREVWSLLLLIILFYLLCLVELTILLVLIFKRLQWLSVNFPLYWNNVLGAFQEM